MGKIYLDKTIENIHTEKHSLYQRNDGYKIFVQKNVYAESGGWHCSDDDSYITGYATELMNLSGQSILITGLGLGLMAYYIRNSFTSIDVIEIDEDLVSLLNSQNLLSSNTNPIIGDALLYSFSETKKWDYIVIDTIYEKDINLKELYKQKYLSKLNTNGFLYMPIFQEKFFNT